MCNARDLFQMREAIIEKKSESELTLSLPKEHVVTALYTCTLYILLYLLATDTVVGVPSTGWTE